ncbi:MAG TPA: hypothetical protein VFO76_10710 [Candidatus Kapabacteria bacterium]|nr:hypothetical protein [Candidatus Kapabacteria bacterium]
MKKRVLSFLLPVALLYSCSKKPEASTASSFEGVIVHSFIVYKNVGNDTTTQYYYYKNGKAITQTKNNRMGKFSTAEYSTPDKEYFPVGDTLIELDLKDIEQYHATSSRASYKPLMIESKDEKEINGWQATRSTTGLDGGRKADLWITAKTPEIAYAEYDRVRHLPIERKWRRLLFDSLAKNGLTIVRADMFSENLTLSTQISLIERRSLPDSLFELPKGIPIKHWSIEQLKAELKD